MEAPTPLSLYCLPLIPLQGRMLHVLPSTIKKEASEDTDAPGSSSYKKKKESKEKANSSRCLPAASLWAVMQALLPRPCPFPAAGYSGFL